MLHLVLSAQTDMKTMITEYNHLTQTNENTCRAPKYRWRLTIQIVEGEHTIT